MLLLPFILSMISVVIAVHVLRLTAQKALIIGVLVFFASFILNRGLRESSEHFQQTTPATPALTVSATPTLVSAETPVATLPKTQTVLTPVTSISGLEQQMAENKKHIYDNQAQLLDKQKQMVIPSQQLSSETIKNIINSKQEISDRPEFQQIISTVMAAADTDSNNTEYQQVIKKLNTLSKSDIDGKCQQRYNELKLQAAKCFGKAVGSNVLIVI